MQPDLDPVSLLHSPTLFSIDLAKIADSTQDIGGYAGSQVTTFDALKSNAHGFGLAEIARTLLIAEADAAAVVSWRDARSPTRRIAAASSTLLAPLYCSSSAASIAVCACPHQRSSRCGGTLSSGASSSIASLRVSRDTASRLRAAPLRCPGANRPAADASTGPVASVDGLRPSTLATGPSDGKPSFASLVLDTLSARFLFTIPYPEKSGTAHGVVPIGKSDGVQVLACGFVHLRGPRAPTLGASLEHPRIGVTDIGNTTIDDGLVLIGSPRGDSDHAERCRTSLWGRLSAVSDWSSLHVGAPVYRKRNCGAS